MKAITIQVPDELYDLCQQLAIQSGRPLEECIVELILRHTRKSRPLLSDEERTIAMDLLRRHAGAQSLGYPTGADNESIDADLAREYGTGNTETP